MYAIVNSGEVVDLVSVPVGANLGELTHLSQEQIKAAVEVPNGFQALVKPGWKYANGEFTPPERPAPPLSAEPTDPAQRAVAALMGGCEIAWKGMPDISGTYPIDPVSRLEVLGILNYVADHGRFPGGVSGYPRRDVAGKVHLFPDTGAFAVWATALANYAARLEIIRDTGEGDIPRQPVVLE